MNNSPICDGEAVAPPLGLEYGTVELPFLGTCSAVVIGWYFSKPVWSL